MNSEDKNQINNIDSGKDIIKETESLGSSLAEALSLHMKKWYPNDDNYDEKLVDEFHGFVGLNKVP